MENVAVWIPPLLIALVCPLIMLFMMRGMHRGSHKHGPPLASADEAELEQLRREVAALRDQPRNPP